MPLTARTCTVRRLKPVPATSDPGTALAETSGADHRSTFPGRWSLVGMRVAAGGFRAPAWGEKPDAPVSPFSPLTDAFHGCRLSEWTVIYERKLPRGGFDGTGGPGCRASDRRVVREPAREIGRVYDRRQATPA